MSFWSTARAVVPKSLAAGVTCIAVIDNLLYVSSVDGVSMQVSMHSYVINGVSMYRAHVSSTTTITSVDSRRSTRPPTTLRDFCSQPTINPSSYNSDYVLLNRWKARNYDFRRGEIVSLM